MISVIIPVADEKFLGKCLASLDLARKKISRDSEIILVNNRPQNVKIKEITSNYSTGYEELKHPGSYRSRNLGARKSKGDILAFTDSDCVVSEDWLLEITRSLESAEAVMGRTNGINANKTARLEQIFYDTLQKEPHVDTRNFAIKKTVFDQVGGFNEKLAFGGDMEFGAKLLNQGFEVIADDKMLARHHNPTRIFRIILKRITQNFDNYNITEFHDDDFIEKYFPNIFVYKQMERSRLLVRLKFTLFQMLLGFNYFLSPVIIFILPTPLAAIYYRKLNGLCMHFGYMANILKRR